MKTLHQNAQSVFKVWAWLDCFPTALSLERLLLPLFCRWGFQSVPAPGEERSLARGKSSDALLCVPLSVYSLSLSWVGHWRTSARKWAFVTVLQALKEMGNTPVSSYFIVGGRKEEGW